MHSMGAEAVADANKAIELDSSNYKAYLRKGTACFSLEEYQTAKTAFKVGSTIAPEDPRFTDWIKKCDNVTIDVPGEDAYIFQPRLFGKIVPARCRYQVLSTKVEIRLAKAEPIHWTSLEYGQNNVVAVRSNVSTASSTNKEDTKFKRFWIQSNPRKCSSGEDVQVVENGDVEMSKFKDGNHMFYYGSVTMEFATESLLRILQRKDSYGFYNGSVPTDFATEYIGYGIKSVAALQRK
ncbi:hypothetical protein LXL04_019707 [Taraxacum kok-saghyz]